MVVLSISVTLANGQQFGNAPATTIYDAFAGGLAILAWAIGTTALKVEYLGPISLIVDSVVAVTSLAGGIGTAAQLRGTDCGFINTIYDNNLLNGGLQNDGTSELSWSQIQARCIEEKANTAFMFLGFVMAAILLALSFKSYKRAK